MIFDPMSPKYNEKIFKQSIEAMNALTRMAEIAREHERDAPSFSELPDGVAGRVLVFLRISRDVNKTGSELWFRIDGEYQGAAYMLAKLSRETREMLMESEAKLEALKAEPEKTAHVWLEIDLLDSQIAGIVLLAHRLGLELETDNE